MITFGSSSFDILSAELVVLDRGGKVTWGIYIKGLSNPAIDLRAPQFTLFGIPFPAAGLDALIDNEFSLPEGESEGSEQPQALVYVWDWLTANNNFIRIARHEHESVLVSWSGTCADPEFYDSRESAYSFYISGFCKIRYET